MKYTQSSDYLFASIGPHAHGWFTIDVIASGHTRLQSLTLLWVWEGHDENYLQLTCTLGCIINSINKHHEVCTFTWIGTLMRWQILTSFFLNSSIPSLLFCKPPFSQHQIKLFQFYCFFSTYMFYNICQKPTTALLKWQKANKPD